MGPSPVISFRDGNEPCKIGKEQNASLLAILLFYDFIGRSPRRARSEASASHAGLIAVAEASALSKLVLEAKNRPYYYMFRG